MANACKNPDAVKLYIYQDKDGDWFIAKDLAAAGNQMKDNEYFPEGKDIPIQEITWNPQFNAVVPAGIQLVPR